VRLRAPKKAEPVHSITTLPTSVADDQKVRVRSYLLSMGVRTLAFLAAGGCVALGWTIAAWVCLGAAVILPYPAVIIANAAANRKSHFMEPATPWREIGTAEDRDASADQRDT
jgi:DUF3099 family protein